MFDLVKKSILTFGYFSNEELQQIFGRMKMITLKKDAYLVLRGQHCEEFYFIHSGHFRHYNILEDGTEAILNLYVEEDWVFDYKSVIFRQTSENYIQATDDAVVLELSAQDFHELIKISDSFFRVGGIFQQVIQNHDYQHNRLSPEEKYVLLLKSKPQIIQKFPLKYIASYLGITPETLSRVRRKIIS